MATLKSINESLPRFDRIRREYWLHGWGGIMDCKIGYMDAAFADLDEKGNCVDITIYSGPGMSPKHYYSESYPREVVDITDILEGVLNPENSGYTPSLFRRYIVGQIKEKIESQLAGLGNDAE